MEERKELAAKVLVLIKNNIVYIEDYQKDSFFAVIKYKLDMWAGSSLYCSYLEKAYIKLRALMVVTREADDEHLAHLVCNAIKALIQFIDTDTSVEQYDTYMQTPLNELTDAVEEYCESTIKGWYAQWECDSEVVAQ